MEWLYFAAGIVCGLLLALFALMRYGKTTVYVPAVTPSKFESLSDLQTAIKALMSQAADGEQIYVQSVEPKFLVRVRKRTFKAKPDALVVDVRSSDDNGIHYAAVRSALATAGQQFTERFTPKLRQPKDLRLQVDVGTYAPSAIAGILQTIFTAVGADPARGLHVSRSTPLVWNRSTFIPR